MDVGAGSGVLSFFSLRGEGVAQLGKASKKGQARRVYAVE